MADNNARPWMFWVMVASPAILAIGLIALMGWTKASEPPPLSNPQICYRGKAASPEVVARLRTTDGGEIVLTFPVADARMRCGR